MLKRAEGFLVKSNLLVWTFVFVLFLAVIAINLRIKHNAEIGLSPIISKPGKINVCDPSKCHDVCNKDGSLIPCGCSLGGCSCQTPKSDFCPSGTGTCLLNPQDGTGFCYTPGQLIKATNYCCKCGMTDRDYGWYVNACPSSCIHIVGTEADNKCGVLAIS